MPLVVLGNERVADLAVELEAGLAGAFEGKVVGEGDEVDLELVQAGAKVGDAVTVDRLLDVGSRKSLAFGHVMVTGTARVQNMQSFSTRS